MATKWKKWKNNIKSNIACVAFVLGVSLLITGGMGAVRQLRFGNSMASMRQMLADSDYQNGDRFWDFMANRLDVFLDMGNGDLITDNYYGYYGDYGYYDYDEAIGEFIIQAEAEEGTYAVSEEEEEALYDAAAGYNLDETELTDEKKREIIGKYHDTIKSDQNVLYCISRRGTELYSNVEQVKWDRSGRNLPEGYNFYLYFDGQKAIVKKDGRDLDIYGDGIYREGEDWCIPGYRNFTAGDKWKDLEVVILAAQKPVRFLQSVDDRYNYRYGSGLYGIYQDYIEERSLLFRTVACLSIGLVLCVLYLLLRNQKRELNQKIAAVTAKMWFEWKVLLGVVLPFLLVCSGLRQDGFFTYAYDMALAGDIPYFDYTSEMSYYLLGSFSRYSGLFLLMFWLFYAFVVDLCRNKGGYKKGICGKCAKILKSRDLKLSVSKRIVKRTWLLFGLTAALLIYLLCVFLVWILWDYRMSRSDTAVWCVEGAFALAAALFAAQYIYQKKNRRFAEELELLEEQLGGIRDGRYEAGEASSFEDADLRHMAEELEDIRQGLETAVEERISSERMKVELVANVSHDIKTPLTSIISYIQLLKQEENLPDYISDYIRILDEKSERLKNMVQDVFAVSKAASGQLSVELKELDLGKLLYQTLADMEEPIQKSPVTVRTEIPKEPVMVCTDGQRMYRVFQNLIGNALKYSLEGSRVYVTLKEEGALAVASVKNTSSEELDREIDFAERFTRGDESRTDGGSGLGLSIARSFTEACGGTFELELIADLFVVTVSLPRVCD